MKDRTDDHLNGGGVIAKHEDGIFVWVIATIGGGILILKRKDPILQGPTLGLGPQVCFAPLNCFAHHTTNLVGGHLRCFGR